MADLNWRQKHGERAQIVLLGADGVCQFHRAPSGLRYGRDLPLALHRLKVESVGTGDGHAQGPVQRGTDHPVLREQEAGKATEEVCRQHGISTTTFYRWKAKYGGLEISEARRLKALEDENRQLKRLLADSMLDNVALRDLLAKNG